MSVDYTDRPTRRLIVAEMAVDEGDDRALVMATTAAMLEACDDPELLIDAGHELLAVGRKRRAQQAKSNTEADQ